MRTLFAAAFFLVPVAACGLFPDIEPYGRCANGGCADANIGDGAAEGSPDGGCPGTGGPKMVRTRSGCIDSTEVTVAQYQAFVTERNGAIDAGGVCAFNKDYRPPDWVGNTNPNAPIRGVDWCDARDFCAWAGKRLCGAVGGGSLTHADWGKTPTKSEWFMACSQQNSARFGYGSTFVAGACHLADDGGQPAVAPVASFPLCQVAGDSGIYDMIGNAQEWIDACDDAPDPAKSRCAVVGGLWTFAPANGYDCAFEDPSSYTREAPDNWSNGFRCCAN